MVHRNEHNEAFTQIDNSVLRNVNLSFEARGFLVYLLSFPDDWSFTVRGLVKQTGNSKSTILRLMNELKAAGYIKLEKHKDKYGKFTSSSWHIYESAFESHIPQKRNTAKTEHGENGTRLERNTVNPESRFTEHGENGPIRILNINEDLNKQITKDNEHLNKKDGVVSEVEKMFIEFWSIYPKKVDKKGSFRAFKNIPKLKEVFPGILKALEVQKQSSQWTKDNGQYIPNPTTYIHQERWLTVNEADALQAVQNQITMNSLDDFNFWGGKEDAQ